MEYICAGHLIDKLRYASSLSDWLQGLRYLRGCARSYVPKNGFYKTRRAVENA